MGGIKYSPLSESIQALQPIEIQYFFTTKNTLAWTHQSVREFSNLIGSQQLKSRILIRGHYRLFLEAQSCCLPGTGNVQGHLHSHAQWPILFICIVLYIQCTCASCLRFWIPCKQKQEKFPQIKARFQESIEHGFVLAFTFHSVNY